MEINERNCNACNRPMPQGVDGGGNTVQMGWYCCDEYFCSEACLYGSFNDDHQQGKLDWENHYDDGGDCYYTEWEIEDMEGNLI